MAIILPFLEKYSSGVRELILPIQQIEFGVPVTIEDQPDLLEINNFYQRGKGNFWVAIEGEQVVGTIGLIDIGHHSLALRKMFVHAAYRGKTSGIGKQLLDTALEWSRNNGIRKIYLGTVEQLVAARRFYEKNGFIEVAKNSLPDYFPRMEVDTRFYMISL
ncbi:GNAT family N-acetyltransferase [Flavihumibacter stibioxidans]|uniref:GNAT family acetyltransferase n=1 Tax=Flavihumibacter stibioxidans TaxID=1834163 RepID=A0ABR7MA33_9BACT|nr:GNAT family N-acetyltransferase [Flavihumibacter stibioxidans]MBC6491684.1 GNAT family acetyltransferase [Flavihumibacter stibioxidans]